MSVWERNGNVQQKEWGALCENLHPNTGKKLTPRLKAERTVGYDFNFHVSKSVSLAELGLPIERKKKGWELAGVSRELIEKFSRRKAHVDEKARELGIDDPEEESELVVKTREKKEKGLTLPELRNRWLGRMSQAERRLSP